jgi:hypothetical protein
MRVLIHGGFGGEKFDDGRSKETISNGKYFGNLCRVSEPFNYFLFSINVIPS